MPSLLTVTGGRIDLDANHSYVLGRGTDCDIIVSDPAASRRHATLTIAGSGDAAFVQDMKSRNGTFLNDEKVKRRTRMPDGSRLRIGSTLYLFTLLDANGHELSEANTETAPAFNLEATCGVRMLGFGGERGEVANFAGQLSSFGIIEILQMLVTTHRSGTLHIETERGQARVEIRGGDVHAATFEELEGFPALLMMARQGNGIFWMARNDDEVRRTIRERPGVLIVELCRSLDELRQTETVSDG